MPSPTAIPGTVDLECVRALVGNGVIAERDAKLRLGHALNKLRPQFPHGRWDDFLASVPLNRKTANFAMRVARDFADGSGRFDRVRFEQARAVAAMPIDDEPSFTQLRELSMSSGKGVA